MKRSIIVVLLLIGAAGVYFLMSTPRISSQQPAPAAGQAPAAPAEGRGRGPSPEQQAALDKQDALEKATPQLQITEQVLPLVVPGHTIGETTGVAKDSKGHLYVFTRSGNAGPA